MIPRKKLLWTLSAVLLLPACTAVQESQPVAEKPMEAGATSYALYAPIPADQLSNWKSMIEQAKAKHEMHVASNEACGIDEELVFFQETPQGAAAVVYFEGNDLEHMLSKRGAAEDEYTKWFVSQIRNIHHLPENLDEMPANTLVFQGDVPNVEGETRPFVMAAPILAGKEAAHAAFVAELAGARHAAWEESRRSRGIAKEYAWNQENPDGSMTTVVYFEVTDLANLNKPAATEFEKWFRQQVLDIHGIPLDAAMPANTLAASF